MSLQKNKSDSNIFNGSSIAEKNREAYRQPEETNYYLGKKKTDNKNDKKEQKVTKKDKAQRNNHAKKSKGIKIFIPALAITFVLIAGIFLLQHFVNLKEDHADNLFIDDQVVVKVGDKYGLISKDGDMIYQAKYDWLVYYDDISVFASNEKYGLMNQDEKVILNPEFDSIVYDDQAKVYYLWKQEGEESQYLGGLADKTGKIIVPAEYEEIGYDSESGITGAMKKDKKWVYIDDKGKELKLFNGKDYEGTGEPHKGLILIKKATEETDEISGEPVCLYGLANTKGEILIETKYQNIQLMKESEDMIPFEENGKWGYISTEGEIVIKPQYDGIEAADKFENGYAVVELASAGVLDKYYREYEETERLKAESEELGYGIVDKEGEYIVQPKCVKAKILDNGKFFFEKKFTWGLIDKEGNTICEYDKDDDLYEEITGEFCEGVCVIQKTDENGETKYGLINEAGKVIAQCIYDEIGEYDEKISNHERILVKKEKKYGYVNTEGEEIIPLDYTYASHFYDDGYAVVIDSNKKAMIINKENECILGGNVDGFMHYDVEDIENEGEK